MGCPYMQYIQNYSYKDYMWKRLNIMMQSHIIYIIKLRRDSGIADHCGSGISVTQYFDLKKD